MKRSLLFILLFPVALMLGSACIFQNIVLDNIQWLFVVIVTGMVWLGFILVFLNINQQVDNNPYYTQMVLRKRDEVRLRQKMYATTAGKE